MQSKVAENARITPTGNEAHLGWPTATRRSRPGRSRWPHAAVAQTGVEDHRLAVDVEQRQRRAEPVLGAEVPARRCECRKVCWPNALGVSSTLIRGLGRTD